MCYKLVFELSGLTIECDTMILDKVVFLSKLRSGNSNKMIAAIWKLKQEQLVSDYAASIMNFFQRDVLPSRSGLNAFSICELIDSHTTDVSKILINSSDELMLICNNK